MISPVSRDASYFSVYVTTEYIICILNINR